MKTIPFSSPDIQDSDLKAVESVQPKRPEHEPSSEVAMGL